MERSCKADADSDVNAALRARRSVQVHCDVHQKLCPAFPEKPTPGHYQGVLAGVTCVDWSTMNRSSSGWLGPSGAAFVEWLHSRCLGARSGTEDWIIVECVRGFDHTLLEDCLKQWYDMCVLLFSPTLLGVPAMRWRKYMLLTQRPPSILPFVQLAISSLT